VGGAVSLASTLSVGGVTNFGSTVTIAGAVSLASTLDVGGNTSVGGTFLATGKAEFEDDVSVSGNTVLGGTLRVAGATSLEGAVDLNSTLTVAGAVSLNSTLSVGGATNLLSTVTATGNAGFLGTVRVSGNTSLEGQLQLTESAAAAVHTTAINGVTSVSLNFGIAQNFLTTVTAAHTLARPTNARVGQVGSIFLVQSGGSGVISYNGCFKFPGGTAPTFATSNGAVSRIDYIVASISSDNTGENIHAIMTQEYA
jgi:cytoskeletal protein CcmA (bactofilin family)